MSGWDHVQVTCANCGAPIVLHRDHEVKLRDTHARFYCPTGHSNYFPGKTRTEKELDHLRKRLAMEERHTAEWQDRWEQATESRRVLVAAVQVCPLGCGHVGNRRLTPFYPTEDDLGRFLDRVGHDLTEHLVACHNATGRLQRLLTSGGAT